MKIVDVKIDKDYEGRFGLEIIGANGSYVITEFDHECQWTINSNTFVYFDKIEIDDNRIFFRNNGVMIGLINYMVDDYKVRELLKTLIDEFNRSIKIKR